MNWKKLSFYTTHIVYPIATYLCFCLMTFFIFAQYDEALKYYDQVAAMSVRRLLLIPILLAFYSTARIFVVYDTMARTRFYERGGTDGGFLRRLKQTVCSYEFLVSAIIMFFIVWLMAPTLVYRSVLDMFFDAGSVAAQNRLSRAIFIPVSLGLLLLAHLSARKHWHQVRGNSALRDIASAVGLLALAGLAYGMGTIILLLVYPLMKFVVQPAVGIPLLLIILALTGVILFFAYGRALRRRRRFVKALLSLCKREGFDITPIEHPYRSLFFLVDGPSFAVTAHKKTYTCKLLSCVRRRNTEIHFFEDGACRFVRVLRMVVRRSRFLVQTEFAPNYYVQTEFTFAFEGEGKKLLIVDPMPRMFLTDMGKSIPLTTGDKVWSYKIFSAAAFLGCLERNCLDR